MDSICAVLMGGAMRRVNLGLSVAVLMVPLMASYNIFVAATSEVDSYSSPPMTSQHTMQLHNNSTSGNSHLDFHIYIPLEPMWMAWKFIGDSGLLFELVFCSILFGVIGGFRNSRQAKHSAIESPGTSPRGSDKILVVPSSAISNAGSGNGRNHVRQQQLHRLHPDKSPSAATSPSISTAISSPMSNGLRNTGPTPRSNSGGSYTHSRNNSRNNSEGKSSDHMSSKHVMRDFVDGNRSKPPRYPRDHYDTHSNNMDRLPRSSRLVSPVVRVNQVITNLSCPFKILDYVCSQAEETKLSAINIATALHRVAKTCRGANVKVDDVRKHAKFQTLTRMVLNMLDVGAFKAQELSNVSWALATLRHRNPELLRTIAHRIVQRMGSFNGQEITNVVWSMATLAYPDEHVFHTVRSRVMELLPTLLPMEIGNITWAYATTGNLSNDMADSIAECAMRAMHQFQPHALAITTWAFTTAKFEHRGFLRAVSNRVQQYRLKDMNTQDISNFSWGFATFYQPSHPTEFQAVFRTLADGVSARVHEFVLPQSISNTLWAFATVGYRHPGVEKLGHLAQTIVSCFNAQGVVNTMWAMRVLGYLDYHGFELFLNTVPRKFRFVSPATFSYFLHTLAMFECNDLSRLEPLFASVEFYAASAPVDMCCRIVWSLAALRCPLSSAFQIVGDRLTSHIHANEAIIHSDAERALWAFMVSGHESHEVVQLLKERAQLCSVTAIKNKCAGEFDPSPRHLGA